jgi:hypothetical protein
METLAIKSNRFWPLFGNLIFPDYLTADNENIVCRRKFLKIPWFGSWSFVGKAETNVSIEDVAFYDSDGFLNNTIEFGYADQITFKGISKANAKLLKEHFIRNGAKIGKEGLSFKSLPFTSLKDIFRPMKWFMRETLILTDEALIFNTKKLYTNKTTYIPYNKISYGYFAGHLSKKIFILGEQNIFSKYTFSRKCAKLMQNNIKDKGVQIAAGKSYRPFIFGAKRNIFNPPRLICTENELVYLDLLPGKPKEVKILKYKEIKEYKKVKWYSLLGTIMISGETSNIRSGQEMELTITMLKMWFFRWKVFFISTGILAMIKKHST